MELWQKCLLAAGIGLFLLTLAVRSAVRKRRDQTYRAFARKLETVLQPRESIKLICPEKQGQLILTSRRLLIETSKGFQAIPFKTIKRVQGLTAGGKKTVALDKMASLTIKTDKEHTISGTTPEFTQLAKQLIRKVEAQNRRKKAEKEKRKEKK